MINSRRKGKGGELEFAKVIEQEIGIRLHRNLDQTRQGGDDLDPLYIPPLWFSIEVKRKVSFNDAHIEKAWRQAIANCGNKYPLLAYRADRQKWRIMIPIMALDPDLPAFEAIDYTAVLSPKAFGLWAREKLRRRSVWDSISSSTPKRKHS